MNRRRWLRRLLVLRWLPWLLALTLLQAQALGQWHRVAHVPGAAATWFSAAADDHEVFGHAAGDDAQCRLYDAVGSAAGPWSVPGLTLAPPVAQGVQAAQAQPSAGRTLRPYQVRAPPRG
jgi:hypothetical protein